MVLQQEAFEGCVLGLAIGDALGAPAEFRTLAQMKSSCGGKGLTGFLRVPASYTEDTQMTLCIARALIEAGEKGHDTIMQAVSREFVEWWKSPENSRHPDRSCVEGCRSLAEGVHWRESGLRKSKWCGSAVRTSPIGLYYHDDEARLIRLAAASSLPTDAHPTGVASAVATAYLTALALRGETRSCVDRLVRATEDIDPDFVEHMGRIPDALRMQSEEEALEFLGRGWFGEEAVALALYCFLLSPKDFCRTVLRAANTEGDSDSIACIAGAISGAYNGVEAIPSEWVRDVEGSLMLRETARRLFEARGG